MNKAQRKRLHRVSGLIDAMPIPPAAQDAAYQRFKETGELPVIEKLAAAVATRALRCPNGVSPFAGRELTFDMVVKVMSDLRKPELQRDLNRNRLFAEAVYGWEVVRTAARFMIQALVGMGQDVEDPDFVDEDMELPDWGGVGLHLLGFPECIVKPPYKRQAERLFRRMDELRERVDRDDAAWTDEYGEATLRFLREGDLPDDELVAEAAMAYGEFMWLVAHYLGVGDAEVMEVFDRAARGRRADRARAVERLQAMGAERRLLPGVSSVPDRRPGA